MEGEEEGINDYGDEEDVKLEFEEEVVDFNNHDDRDFHAQALMTLHQSAQNLPKKHKQEGLETSRETSLPPKRPRSEEGFIYLTGEGNHPHLSSVETPHLSQIRFDPNKTHTNNEPAFNQTQLRSMKVKLGKMLKLDGARRWVYYEWFYSNIDRSLILGQTDFESCLKQLFANLKTRKLTRMQWTMIRRLMGKPRRCSPAFFAEERAALEEKRKKIRYLHQLKGFEVKDMTQFKDLPEEIPMPMVIGTKVTAKVCPSGGGGLHMFTGTVDAVDNINNTYRIYFDRVGIGTHSIADVEVASEDYEPMNLQLFVVKERPKIAGTNSPPEAFGTYRNQRSNDVLDSSPSRIKLAEALNNDVTGTFGGFPIRFLLYMTRLSKVIALKKKYVDKLKELNGEAELRKPLQQIKREFQKTYAFVILELDKINKELDTIFAGIHSFVRDIAPQLGFLDETVTKKTQCDGTASLLVEQSNRIVTGSKMRGLVTKFTSLMLQITRFSEGSHGAYELSSIDEAVKDIKASLDESNKKLFENKVETGITFIKNGLHDVGTMLDAFSNNASKKPKCEYNSPEPHVGDELTDVGDELTEVGDELREIVDELPDVGGEREGEREADEEPDEDDEELEDEDDEVDEDEGDVLEEDDDFEEVQGAGLVSGEEGKFQLLA